MKRIAVFLLSLVLIAGLAACGGETKQLGEVNVFSWTGYIDDDTLAAFEKETGIHVTWTSMESIDDMLLKLRSGDTSQYDIMLSSDYSLGILKDAGLIEKLDKSKLPNWNNLDPRYLGQYYDENDEYVVPYICGCTLLVYDSEMLPEGISSYADLWDEALANNVCLLSNPRVICGMAAKSIGYGFNETDTAVLDKISEQLNALRPNVSTANDDSGYAYMSQGQAAAAFMYMPFASMANDERQLAGLAPLEVAYPEEGMGFGIDGFVVAKGSKNYDNAMKLLDWLMKPEVAAHNAEAQMYGNVNRAAEDYLSEEYKSNSFINIPGEVIEDAEMIRTLDSELEARYNEIYTEFINK